ncbi:MAG: hypothetical protein NC311_08885 [Muribaculaceae bacterium]|nr:hypothetical protein [Muribaculaceae bacterium]
MMKWQKVTAADVQGEEIKEHSHHSGTKSNRENDQWNSAIETLRRFTLKNGIPSGLYIDDGKAITLIRQ